MHPSVEGANDRVTSREWEDPPVRPPVSKPWPSGMEFYGMREYVPGDDLRHIHWRTSARTGTLVVKHPITGEALDKASAAALDTAAKLAQIGGPTVVGGHAQTKIAGAGHIGRIHGRHLELRACRLLLLRDCPADRDGMGEPLDTRSDQ